MVFIVILLVILLSVSFFINVNLYKKYETLESIHEETQNASKENEEFILSIKNRVMSQQSYLKQLDRKGAFESDDEIGFFFKELKKIIKDISVFFNEEQIEDEEIQITSRFNGRIQ